MNSRMCGHQENGGKGFSLTLVELLIEFLLLSFYVNSFLPRPPRPLAILASKEGNFLLFCNTSSVLALLISLEVKCWCRSRGDAKINFSNVNL